MLGQVLSARLNSAHPSFPVSSQVVRLFGYFVCNAIPARIVDSDNNTVRNTFIFEADKVDFVEPDVVSELH